MRGSSMDSRGMLHDHNRQTPIDNPRVHASGSDGFAMSQFSDNKNMQSTFLSGGALGSNPSNYGTSSGFGMTGTSINAFKKR